MDRAKGQRLPIQDVVSAGGIVWRREREEVQVVVCGRQASGGWVWSLPKGYVAPGESLEEAALREVSEETGLKVALQEELGSIRYWFTVKEEGKRYHKTVHHYLMAPTGGSLEEHDEEFDRVEWLGGAEALGRLTYPNEVELLRQALARLGDVGREAPVLPEAASPSRESAAGAPAGRPRGSPLAASRRRGRRPPAPASRAASRPVGAGPGARPYLRAPP